MLTPKEVMEECIKALVEKKAKNIEVLRTSDLTVVADYFVMCTASSSTHIKSLTDEVERHMEERDERHLSREGYRSGGWVLLDYGCVILHIFVEETREFYALERLWSDAESIDVSSLIGPQ